MSPVTSRIGSYQRRHQKSSDQRQSDAEQRGSADRFDRRFVGFLYDRHERKNGEERVIQAFSAVNNRFSGCGDPFIVMTYLNFFYIGRICNRIDEFTETPLFHFDYPQ